MNYFKKKWLAVSKGFQTEASYQFWNSEVLIVVECIIRGGEDCVERGIWRSGHGLSGYVEFGKEWNGINVLVRRKQTEYSSVEMEEIARYEFVQVSKTSSMCQILYLSIHYNIKSPVYCGGGSDL